MIDGAARLRDRARAERMLDANADMPVHPEALAAYVEASSFFADHFSAHAAGREAAGRLDYATRRIAAVLGCAPDALWFTSGGTEADAVALEVLARHAGPARLMVSSIEHAAVAKTAALLARRDGLALAVVTVGRNGCANADGDLAARGVSVVAASNETGALQPIAAIADRVHRQGGLVHSDGAQLPGRAVCDVAALGADVVTFSSHKVGAPGGVGLVVARPELMAGHAPRASANVPGIVALARAFELLPDAGQRSTIAASRDAIENGLRRSLPGVFVVAGEVARLANTSCIGFDGCDGDAVMMALDVRGIAVSTGSACGSGSIEPSPILLGMGLTPREARSTIRISLPGALDAATVDEVVTVIADVVTQARA